MRAKYPRTADFEPISTSPLVPTDAAWLVRGIHSATDYGNISTYGQVTRRSTGEMGIEPSAGISSRAWLAYTTPSQANSEAILSGFYAQDGGSTRQAVQAGVMVRLQSITGVSNATLDRWWAASAYVLRLEINAAAQTCQVILERVVAGVATELTSTGPYTLNEYATFKLQLLASGTGGTVALTGRLNGTLVSAYSDTNAARLTSAGLAGFLTDYQISSTHKTRVAARWFRVNDGSSIAQIVDDFDRPNRVGTATAYTRSLWHDTAAMATVYAGGDGYMAHTPTDAPRVSLWQARVQADDYSAKARFTLPDTAASYAGIAVRASQTSVAEGTGGFTGYLATITGSSSSNNVAIYRIINGASTEIRRGSKAVTPGTEFEFRVRTWFSGSATMVRITFNGSIILTATDDMAARLTHRGQAGVTFLRASGGGAVLMDDFFLDDGGDTIDEGATVAMAGEAVEIAPADPRDFHFDVACSGTLNGTNKTFTLGVQPHANTAAAIFIGTARVRIVTSGTPTTDQAKVTLPLTVTTGFGPYSHTPVRAMVVSDAGSDVVVNADLTAQVNGATTTFTLPEAIVPGTLRLFTATSALKPVATTPGAFEFQELSTTTVSVKGAGAAALASGQWLIADYVKAGGSSRYVFNEAPSETANGIIKAFTVSGTPDPLLAAVQVGPSHLRPTSGVPGPAEFRVSGSTFTLGFAPLEAQAPLFFYEEIDPSTSIDLPVTPSYPYEESERVRSTVVEFETRATQAWPWDTATRRTFRLHWDNLTAAEFASLIAFFEARRGPLEQIRWTPPDDGSPILACVVGPVEHEKKAPGVYDVRAEMVELIAA